MEVFSSAAIDTLDNLSQLIAGQGNQLRAEEIAPLISDDFTCTSLRPQDRVRAFADQAVAVWRPTRGSAPDAITPFHDVDGLLHAIGLLWEPLRGARDVSVWLKLFRVDRQDDRIDTAVLFQARGRQRNGVIQQSAIWRCGWTTPAAGQSPRIKSIRVVDYEEVIPLGEVTTLLADCTSAVFGKSESFVKHLAYGTDHWRRQLDVSFDPDLSGHQGMAIGDVNGDGLDDVYICQQGGLPNRLFLQLHDGTLTDVSASSGTDQLELSPSALLIDLDNDGDQDLALATVDAVLFFENDGSGRFVRRARMEADATLQSLSAADYDLDGDLDIYACGYSPGKSIWKAEGGTGAPLPYYDANNGGPNMLLQNHGHFRFTNATAAVGLDAKNRRFSFAASWEDYDNDGDADLYVANDFGRNNLYRNNGGQFEEVGASAGVEDMASGMSASWGDYDNDGWMDLYVGNMFSSAGNRLVYQRQFLPSAADVVRSQVRRVARGNSLFRNGAGSGIFADVSLRAAVTRGRWAWASKWVDINNDGLEDLVVANGFITHQDTGDL